MVHIIYAKIIEFRRFMEAHESTLKKLLEGVKQFVIPVYQRQFQWNPDERKHKMMTVTKMWSDVVSLMDTDGGSSHFFGSIVTAPLAGSASGVSRFLVIDGQQRLISTSLLLTAIRDAARKLENTDPHYLHFVENIENNYLFNVLREGEEEYRIVPTKLDKENYFHILKGNRTTLNWDKLFRASRYFDTVIQEFLEEKGDSIDRFKLLESLENTILDKMRIVDVSLHDQDDPQDVFESLNYTGIPLSNWDLVRNFLLMHYDEPDKQDEKYSSLIEPIQQNIKDVEDDFLRNYLGMKGKVTTTRNIYNHFKELMTSTSPVDKENEWESRMKDLTAASRFFYLLNNPDEIEDTAVRDTVKFTTDILGMTTQYPIFMKLLSLRDDGSISDTTLISSMKIVSSYLLRRSLQYYGTQGLNKFFPTIVNSIGNDPESALRNELSRGYYSVLGDTEFFNTLLTHKFAYGIDVKIIKKLLYEIERSVNKEIPDLQDLQLEHIMPITLSDEWKTDLGEDWERVYNSYLDTIGNFTLTGYNQELQNFSFEKKRTMENGYKDSSLRITKELYSREKWGEKEMNERARKIASQIIEMWKI